MQKPPKNLKFEQALSKLEKIVEGLEEGTLSLEDSLKVFEEGMALSQFCEEKLDEAQGKIEMIVKEGQAKKDRKTIDNLNELKE